MLKKLWMFLFGFAPGKTTVGVAAGALTGAAGVAATGNLDTTALVAGAAAGAAAALQGAAGRAAGEPGPQGQSW